MLRQSLFGLVICLVALVVPGIGVAPLAADRSPVIVVFHDDAPFDTFRQVYRADDRASAHPEAWAYLDPAVAGAVQALEASLKFRADHVYSAALRGFAARLSAEQIHALEQNPLVAYIEADGIMQAFQQEPQQLPWGIDRIDTDQSSTVAGDGTGAVPGVFVFIIDTGIDLTQEDLYVVGHVNFTLRLLLNEDCNGHGTHVSGTAAAIDNTVDVVGGAPGAQLVGVKVLGCLGFGSTSSNLKGVDWVTANAPKPAVANMSLGGSASQALDDAVVNSANSGIFYAVAAGNESQDACNVSPARLGASHDGIMTVAATDINNQEADFSNFGNCVDIWAPGVDILSTKLGGGTQVLSGTSMATPHVTGTAALFLSLNPSATPAAVEQALKAKAVSTGTQSKDSRPITLLFAGDF